MKIKQFTQQNQPYFQVAIPVILAAVLVVGWLWVAGDLTLVHADPISDRTAFNTTNSNVITVGVASALTVIPEIGYRQANAVRLAVEQINTVGGVEIGGIYYNIALVRANSGCNPNQAVAAANALLNAGVVAVIGHSCTLASEAAQPVYAAAGVPMINSVSTGPQLTEQGYTTTFRIISRDDSPPARLATYLRNRLHHQRAAIVVMDGFWGNWVGEVFSDTFTNLGGTITSKHMLTSSEDFTDTLTAIIAENPDNIHIAYDDAITAGLLSKVAHSLGMTKVVIAWTTFSENRELLDDYALAAGTAAEYDLAAMFYRATDDMPGYPDLNSDYIAAGFPDYGDDAQMWGAFAYDAAGILIAAIDRADNLNPADIRSEIAATSDYPGVVGLYEGFDEKGDVIPQWGWMERYQNGEWLVIWPYEVLLPLTLKNPGG